MIETAVQVYIFATMSAAITMLARPDRDVLQRWGYVVMLAAQPAYFYCTVKAEQWGMFALTAIFTYQCVSGIRNRFWRKA